MMDAYDLQQKIVAAWRELSTTLSGATIKRDYPHVPVYVRIGDKLQTVSSLQIEDGKIILEVIHETI